MERMDSRGEEADRVARLDPPTGDVRLVVDTDAANEIDDQFALAYALGAASLDVEAVHAAPFDDDRTAGPADGMERSHEEVRRVLGLLDRDPGALAFRGSRSTLDDGLPATSPAVEDLIERAHADRAGDLHVAAIGAPTNVAAAIRRAPEIVEEIVVVWLGGQPHAWPTADEFNLRGDPAAVRTLFDSGVPLVHVPCRNVAEHLTTSAAELDCHLGERPIAEYLRELFDECADRRGAGAVWTKEIWDLAPIAYLADPALASTHLAHSPALTADLTWNRDPARHLIRVARGLDRDAVFSALFEAVHEG